MMVLLREDFNRGRHIPTFRRRCPAPESKDPCRWAGVFLIPGISLRID